jgi:ParB/RepB/Spo0J family partition protein
VSGRVEAVEQDLRLVDIGEGYGSLRLVNPRAEEQMRGSLDRYGQMSPVVVCRGADGGYELLDGFKRLRASRRLERPTLRARVLKVGARAAKAAVLCLNWVSRSVSDLEEGWVVHALCREDGLTQVEAGQLLGRDRSWVSRRLSLVERLSDEAQSQLRLGLITGTVGRELSRVPRGTQERVLEAVTEHGLGSREVAGLVELLSEVSRKEQERILRAPREALSARGKGPTVVRDPRLSEAGNQLLVKLSRMEHACAQVVSTVGIEGLSRLAPGDLLVLAPALGQAQRASRQASEVLAGVLSAAQGQRDDDLQQP